MIQTASNAETGERFALIGGEWVDVTYGHPALEASAGEAFLIGAGRQFDKFVAGAGNLVDTLQGDQAGIAARASEQSENDRLLAPLQDEHPIATGAGQLAPFLATAPLSGGLATQGAIGFGLGALDYASDGGRQVAQGALGGALDIGGNILFGRLGKMAGRVTRGIRGAARNLDDIARAAREGGQGVAGSAGGRSTDSALARAGELFDEVVPTDRATRDTIIANGEELGMTFTHGQRSGNISQLQFEAAQASTPGIGGELQKAAQRNAQVGETLASRLLGLGEQVGEFTQQQIGEAHDVISAAFSRVAKELGPVRVPQGFHDTLEQIRGAQLSSLNQLDPRFQSVVEPIVDNFQKLLPPPGSTIPATQAMRWRSELAELMKEAGTQGSSLAGSQPSIAAMIDATDGLIRGAAQGTDLASVYNQARLRWRVLKTIENSRAVDVGGGGVNSRTLARAFTREFPEEFARGRLTAQTAQGADSEALAKLMDWTRAMGASKDVVGNSGTATRMFVQNVLTDPQSALMNVALSNTVGRLYNQFGGNIPESLLKAAGPNIPSGASQLPGALAGNAGFPGVGLPNLGGATAAGVGITAAE